MLKNIYVRKDDQPIWEWAQEAAATKGVSLSSWLTKLIQARMYDVGSGQVAEQTATDHARSARSQIDVLIEMLEKGP